jgi:hypothetical protein
MVRLLTWGGCVSSAPRVPVLPDPSRPELPHAALRACSAGHPTPVLLPRHTALPRWLSGCRSSPDGRYRQLMLAIHTARVCVGPPHGTELRAQAPYRHRPAQLRLRAAAARARRAASAPRGPAATAAQRRRRRARCRICAAGRRCGGARAVPGGCGVGLGQRHAGRERAQGRDIRMFASIRLPRHLGMRVYVLAEDETLHRD